MLRITFLRCVLLAGVLASLSSWVAFVSQPTPLSAEVLPAPAAIGPANGSTLDSFGPTLSWTNPQGTTQVQLQIIPVNNDGPGADVYLGSPETSFRIPPPPEWYGLLPDITYTWRVRTSDMATSALGNEAAWSQWSQATFRTPSVTVGTISAVSAGDGATLTTRSPILQWANSNPYVWWYEIELSKDPEFANASVYGGMNHGGVSSNSYQAPGLEPDTLYYWRVRPRLQGDARELTGFADTSRLSAVWSILFTFRTPLEVPSPIFFAIPNPLPDGKAGQFYVYNFCTPAPDGPNDDCPGQSLHPPGTPAADRAVNPRGGNPPYHFQKESGSQFWPFGLMLHPNGRLDGIPVAGQRTFTICAIDLSAHERCATTSLTIDPADEGKDVERPEPEEASQGTYNRKIRVTWRSVPSAEAYIIYRNTVNNPDTSGIHDRVTAPTSGSPFYDDTNLNNDTRYYYWIKALAGERSSPLSREVSGYASHPLSGEWEGTLQIVTPRDGCPSSGTWKAIIRWGRGPIVRWSDSFGGSGLSAERELPSVGFSDSDWYGYFSVPGTGERTIGLRFYDKTSPPTISGSFNMLPLCHRQGAIWRISGSRVRPLTPP